MFGLGLGEILLVAVVLLLAVGPDRIPTFMREAGRIYAQVKRQSDELRRAFVLEADRMDAEERYAKLRERQKAAEEAKKAAQAQTGGVAQEPVKPPPAPVTPVPVPTDLPDGVSAEEWSRLPQKVRDMLSQVPKPPEPKE